MTKSRYSLWICFLEVHILTLSGRQIQVYPTIGRYENFSGCSVLRFPSSMPYHSHRVPVSADQFTCWQSNALDVSDQLVKPHIRRLVEIEKRRSAIISQETEMINFKNDIPSNTQPYVKHDVAYHFYGRGNDINGPARFCQVRR